MKNIFTALLMLLFASCVNQIDSEIESIENKVPISFSAKITPASTRVVDNAFEVGDKVGLYATIAGSSLDEERYIDNLLLSYGKSKKMIPARDVYYPVDGKNLVFYAYYPYSQDNNSNDMSAVRGNLPSTQFFSTVIKKMNTDYKIGVYSSKSWNSE